MIVRLALVAGVAFGMACGSARERDPRLDERLDEVASVVPTLAPAPESPDPVYSPFVVRVPDENAFSVISFKDVGMSLSSDEQLHVYETIAEGLALELGSHMDHDPHSADPANHLSCEGEHVYVDLWQSGRGWGYSLWSGCGEDDQFAHREVEVSIEPDDRVASLQSLTDDIARELRRAVRENCFTRSC